jgi:serine/threonine-protein kinase
MSSNGPTESRRQATPVTFAAGKVLGRYELLAPIARGGMAEVWAARLHGSRGFQRVVAVKTIVAGMMDEAGSEQMLLDEAALASRIQHPNVTATLDLGEQDGVLFLVMEWVDGEPLTVLMEVARRGHAPIPLPIAVNLIGQACQGLHAAHELRDDGGAPLGLVHRDISPHNVLVTHTGTVKLVDFGIAKATNLVSSRTEAGAVKGKFAYMAPEQVRGESVDRRADVFAVGILLYLLTTGRHPHKQGTPAETLHRVLWDEPVPPSKLIEDYPPELERIVLKALSKSIGDRFSDARELFEALAQAEPGAFQPGFESEVASYLESVLGDRSAESKARLRTAQQTIDASKEPTVRGNESNPASVASLRALVVDAGAPDAPELSAKAHVTLPSQGVEELRPPARLFDTARFRLFAAIAGVGVIGSIGVGLSLRSGLRGAANAPEPAATLERAMPLPRAAAPITAAPSSVKAPPRISHAPVARQSKEEHALSDAAAKARRTLARGRFIVPAKPSPDQQTAPASGSTTPAVARDPLAKRY